MNRVGFCEKVSPFPVSVDQVDDLEFFIKGQGFGFWETIILSGKIKALEEVVPAGTFYAITGSEYLGEEGVRVELFSEPFNKYAVQELVKGWAFAEIVGFGIPNSKAVARGQK